MAEHHSQGKKHDVKKIRAHVDRLQREARAEEATILTRDLRERLYTLCYYVEPDLPVEGGNPTKAQAKAAADGILELADQIEKLLGVSRG